MRLAGTLEGTEGLESANANLMGQVTFSYDDERTTRDALVEVMSRGGFREQGFGLSAVAVTPPGSAAFAWRSRTAGRAFASFSSMMSIRSAGAGLMPARSASVSAFSSAF